MVTESTCFPMVLTLMSTLFDGQEKRLVLNTEDLSQALREVFNSTYSIIS